MMGTPADTAAKALLSGGVLLLLVSHNTSAQGDASSAVMACSMPLEHNCPLTLGSQQAGPSSNTPESLCRSVHTALPVHPPCFPEGVPSPTCSSATGNKSDSCRCLMRKSPLRFFSTWLRTRCPAAAVPVVAGCCRQTDKVKEHVHTLPLTAWHWWNYMLRLTTAGAATDPAH